MTIYDDKYYDIQTKTVISLQNIHIHGRNVFNFDVLLIFNIICCYLNKKIIYLSIPKLKANVII